MFQARQCIVVKNTLKLTYVTITFDFPDNLNDHAAFIYHGNTLPRSITSFLKKLENQFSIKLKFNLNGWFWGR